MRGTLGSSWLDYEHFDTVVVQGTTVVLAREAHDVATDSPFSFNVLLTPADGNVAAPEWTGFRKLPFPNELLPVGMEIVNVLTSHRDNQYLVPMTDAGERFRAVAFREFIYVFRRSTDGTLLSTRFRLVREGATATPDRVSYSLESPWEVGLPLNKEPLCEPTFELSMVRGLATDAFDVEIVPMSGGRAMCHVYHVLPDKSKSRVFSLPIDECGQYDLQGLRTTKRPPKGGL